MKTLANLKGVKILNRVEQKNVFGGNIGEEGDAANCHDASGNSCNIEHNSSFGSGCPLGEYCEPVFHGGEIRSNIGICVC